MENHPIPQDVTGFQFKLIGQMTIKQFAYLAVGTVAAVIIWYLPIFILIKLIFIPLLGLSGLAFAFLPVEGRPLDLMATNFLKALVSPNQYIFQKDGGKLNFLNVSLAPKVIATQQKQTHIDKEEAQQKEELLKAYLAQAHTAKNPLDAKESSYVSSLFNDNSLSITTTTPEPKIAIATEPQASDEIQQASPSITPTPPAPSTVTTPQIQQSTMTPLQMPQAPEQQPKPEPIALENFVEEPIVPKKPSDAELASEAQKIQQELEDAKIKEATQQSVEDGKIAHEKVIELDQKLQDVLSDKQKLEEELLALKKQLDKKEDKTAKKRAGEGIAGETQLVRKIPQNMSRQAGMPTPPDVPNLLMGIIKDSRGNVLPNILVEVTDQTGNPVRAFKTNPLGQFASATTLRNGVYTLTFEDPQGQHKFELLELTVNDQIIQPFEIISQDAREELRQQLFN